MLASADEGYFPLPATPIRNNHLSPSPTKGFGSGGSVSSSLLASPPKHSVSPCEPEHGYVDRAAGVEEDTAGSPAVQQLKRAAGFASVRVGLGSPQLALNRNMSSVGRRTGSQTPEYEEDGPSSRVKNVEYGLPTPPGTDSDIAPPPPPQASSRSVSRGSVGVSTIQL